MEALITRHCQTGHQGTTLMGPALARGQSGYHQSRPLCGHPHCSHTHILCNCSGLAAERSGLSHDLALIVNRLPIGPGRALGRAIHHLLFHHCDIANRGQLWTGLWAPRHRALLSPHRRLCFLKEGQRSFTKESSSTQIKADLIASDH